MRKLFLFATMSSVLAVGAMLLGCTNQSSSQPASDQDSTVQHEPSGTDHENHQGHSGEGGAESGMKMTDDPESADHAGHGQYAEALAELTAADRELAERQKTCPVSGQPLGAMGTPYKVTVQGQDVLLCCQGCEAKIMANPEENLAKLPQ